MGRDLYHVDAHAGTQRGSTSARGFKSGPMRARVQIGLWLSESSGADLSSAVRRRAYGAWGGLSEVGEDADEESALGRHLPTMASA